MSHLNRQRMLPDTYRRGLRPLICDDTPTREVGRAKHSLSPIFRIQSNQRWQGNLEGREQSLVESCHGSEAPLAGEQVVGQCWHEKHSSTRDNKFVHSAWTLQKKFSGLERASCAAFEPQRAVFDPFWTVFEIQNSISDDHQVSRAGRPATTRVQG